MLCNLRNVTKLGGTEHVIETGVHRISYDLQILLTSKAAELFEGIYFSHGFYFFAKKKKIFFFLPKFLT